MPKRLSDLCTCIASLQSGDQLPSLTDRDLASILLEWMCNNQIIEAGGGAAATEFDELDSVDAVDATTLADASGVTPSFTSLGTVPAEAYTVTFFNDSDKPVYLSSDNTNRGPYLPVNGHYTINKPLAAAKEFFAGHDNDVPASGFIRVWWATEA